MPKEQVKRVKQFGARQVVFVMQLLQQLKEGIQQKTENSGQLSQSGGTICWTDKVIIMNQIIYIS